MTRHDIQLEHSYNMDEKGFLLGKIGKSQKGSLARPYGSKER
jgi:hypothetical protein